MDGEKKWENPMNKWMIWGENPPFKETHESGSMKVPKVSGFTKLHETFEASPCGGMNHNPPTLPLMATRNPKGTQPPEMNVSQTL